MRDLMTSWDKNEEKEGDQNKMILALTGIMAAIKTRWGGDEGTEDVDTLEEERNKEARKSGLLGKEGEIKRRNRDKWDRKSILSAKSSNRKY